MAKKSATKKAKDDGMSYLFTSESVTKGHPDKVSCIHAIFISVNQMIGREMLKIRNGERNKSKCLEKLL